MSSLTIHDRIYGKHIITSPLLLELIASKPMQRLKKIAQFGIPDTYYHLKNFYRFEHCIGVMLLLKKLGAGEAEQVAGLLHDVSHTAFSHVVDWVLESGHLENYQDEQHEQVILTSQIATILKKYNYNPKEITEYHHFGLLECDIPDLCADRLDYALREFPSEVVTKCLPHIISYNNYIVFDDANAAKLFALHFLQKQRDHWGGFEAVSRYRFFANALKRAIDLRLITFHDLWGVDSDVILKLENPTDPFIQRTLTALKAKSLKSLPKSTEVFHKKFRRVDPYVLIRKKLIRLSEFDKEFADEITRQEKLNKKGIIIPLLS